MSLFERLAQIKQQREATAAGGPAPTASKASSLEAEPERSPLLPASSLGGRECTAAGGCFCLREKKLKQSLQVPFSDTLIYRNLRLIWGIGPVTEARLKDEGIAVISELVCHPRFGADARQVLNLIERRQAAELRRRGATDAELLGLFSPEEIVFLDIETTGLWASQPLFLVGILTTREQEAVLGQLLARHYREERALLAYLAQALQQTKVMITFNGKRFDWPYIKQRLIYYDLPCPDELLQVDLYFHARRLPYDLPNRRLVTLEQNLLGHERVGDVPGYLVPTVYHQFVETQEPRLLAPVLEHNVQDVITLAQLLPLVVPAKGATAHAGIGC